MKKTVYLLLFIFAGIELIAGGLVTNTNQSAMFTRFQCRDATIDIDAAYYNPAGLTNFSRGFYLSVNNQTMGQLKLISSEYSNFGDGSREFNGKVNIPFFPGVYAVYKTGRFAFSGGVLPVSGGGTATYNNGLPSAERVVADLVPEITTAIRPIDDRNLVVTGESTDYSNITGYVNDYVMKSRTLYMGYQVNAAFEINKYFSVAAGIRIVSAKNRIYSIINDASLTAVTNTGTFTESPDVYIRSVATAESDEPESADLLILASSVEQRLKLAADISETGTGYTPVISFNYARSLYTNIAVKYEFKTKLTLVTAINEGKDYGGKYKDGASIIADIPAMLSAGITRRPGNRLMYYVGIHYYFDKPVDFDGISGFNMDLIERNSYEFAIGTEYKLGDILRVSGGWLIARPGVNENYQTETRYSLANNTFGCGMGIRVSRLIDLNLGGSYTFYKKDSREYTYTPAGSVDAVPVTEYYDTRSWVISVGVDFLFGENN